MRYFLATILLSLFTSPVWALTCEFSVPNEEKKFTIAFKQSNNAFKMNDATVWKERDMPMGPEVQAWKLSKTVYAARDLNGMLEYVVNFDKGQAWMKPIGSNNVIKAKCEG